MTNLTNKDVFDNADNIYHSLTDDVCKHVEINQLDIEFNILRTKFYKNQNSHWKFNTFHWANDIKHLADQLVYGFTKMKSHSLAYKEVTTDGQAHSQTYGPVSFYADACILNLYLMREKISLLVWSNFHSFNPNNKQEVLTYLEVVKRL